MLQEIDLCKAFTFLEAGPVILVTSYDGEKNNVMTISWHMVMDFSPHIAISTGAWNYSFNTILQTKQCVIAVPSIDLLDKTIAIGTTSGADIDKFQEYKLNVQEADTVSAPLLTDCLANIECQLENYIEEYGLLIFRGIKVWENMHIRERRTFHANGDGTFVIDGEIRNLRERMRKLVPAGCERF